MDFPLVRSVSISHFHTKSSIYLCFGAGSPYHHFMVRSLRAVEQLLLQQEWCASAIKCLYFFTWALSGISKLHEITNCTSHQESSIDPTSTQLLQGLTCAFRMICQEGRKICFHCRPIEVISHEDTTGSQQAESLRNLQFCFSFQVSGIQIQKVLGWVSQFWVNDVDGKEMKIRHP